MKRWLDIAVSVLLFSILVQGSIFAQSANEHPKNTTAEVAWSDDDTDSNDIGTKQIIGMVEKVHVDPGNLYLDARVDTGANTTSVDAQHLQIVKEDGQDWALFKLMGTQIRSKIVNYVRIKQHGIASQRRPVIMLKVTLGNVSQVVKVTLTDRSNFKYKLLVGVNFLKDHYLVDVSKKYVKEPVLAP